MRALFLTHRLPFAPNRGDRIRAFHMLRKLSATVETHLVSLVHDTEEQSQAFRLREFCASVTTVRVPRMRNLLRALIAWPTDTPLTHVLLDAPDLIDTVRRVAASTRPDVVIPYCSGMARLAMDERLRSLPCVLDMLDVDSAKWAALAKNAVPPRRWIYAREASSLGRFEARAVAHAAVTLVVNERERALLGQKITGRDVRVVANGVDIEAFRPTSAPAESSSVIFCGVMNYEPNEDAALWLARMVWPLVRTSRPDAKLALVGSAPTARILSLPREDPSIEVTGAVPDVRPYLWPAALAVAPLLVARGIQNKVLEAIAAGLPCVVTPAVLEGLPDEARQACAVSDDAGGFAAEILGLLALSGEERRRMAAKVDLGSIDWSATLETLPEILRSVASPSRQHLIATDESHRIPAREPEASTRGARK